MDFRGKVAVVTGGGAGIGRACCQALASFGARVVVMDVDAQAAKSTADGIAEKGGEACPCTVDLRDVSQIRQGADFAARQYGDIHILVNNAGLLHSTPIEEVTEEEWDRLSDVNLKAVFFMTQAVLPYFKGNRYGKIVNISSLAGRNGGFANGLAYSATKAGVIGLTKGLATRLAPFGINANVVCPGTTQTSILDSFTPEKIEELATKIPLGRLGKPEDISSLVCYLCSDEASFITGATIDINGGMYIG